MTRSPFLQIIFPREPSTSVETLVERVLARQPGAWQELWQAVEPRLYALIRRPRFLGRLSQSEDDCRSIVADVLDALQAADHARLRSFMEARATNPSLPFFAWLTVVAKRLAIESMRRPPGGRPPVTHRAPADELLSAAGRELPPDQHAALNAWMAGERFADIARVQGLESPRQAEKLVRSALEQLRRCFRTGEVE